MKASSPRRVIRRTSFRRGHRTMRSTVLRTIHTGNKDAERFQAKLNNAQVRRARRDKSMARRLPNGRQIPARNQYHSNAVRTTHARELGATLAEEPTTRINQFRNAFIENFKSTYKRPTSLEELRACKQGSRESLQAYIQRWTILKNSAEDISNESAIDAFR